MTKKENFKWLTNDINASIVLKVFYQNGNDKKFCGVYNVVDVLETTGEELEVETANIDDLTNLLNFGIVRFVNICDNSDIIDIPFRNLNRLYVNGNILGREEQENVFSIKELDTFAIKDGKIRDDLLIYPGIITYVSLDLKNVMQIASEFGDYGMQEKLDALNNITLINHRRLINDKKNRAVR